jgi:chromosomal replication initiator protein
MEKKHKDYDTQRYIYKGNKNACKEYIKEVRKIEKDKTTTSFLYSQIFKTTPYNPSYMVFPGIKRYNKFKNKKDLMTAILTTVAKTSGISVAQILGRSRRREIVDARYLSMYLVQDIMKAGPSRIGEFFCRDHSSVIHAVRQYRTLMEVDSSEYKGRYQYIKNLFSETL